MTSLQITLLVVAVVAIAVVLIYNFFQNRRVNRRVERSREGMATALKETQQQARQEPVLERFSVPGPEHDDTPNSNTDMNFGASKHSEFVADSMSVDLPPSRSTADTNNGPGNENAAPIPSYYPQVRTSTNRSTGSPPIAAQKGPDVAAELISQRPIGDAWMLRSYGLHPTADCVIDLPLRDPILGEKLLPITNAVRRVGSKSVMFEGQSELGDWEPIVTSEKFVSIRGGVLLANRHGSLNAMEFSDFAAHMQKLADHFEVHISVPDMQATLIRARALDAQCADLDAQIGLNVITNEALSTSDLSTVASEFGLTERGNNRFALLGGHQEVLFSLALGDAPNRLALLLDVPRAPAAANPWGRMADCAQRCVARFGGRLVDDAEKPLSKDALERISNQLTQRYQSLSDANMVAGSPVALRLFN